MADARLVSGGGAPWELLRAFACVVKARWLVDVLRQVGSAGDYNCYSVVFAERHNLLSTTLTAQADLPVRNTHVSVFAVANVVFQVVICFWFWRRIGETLSWFWGEMEERLSRPGTAKKMTIIVLVFLGYCWGFNVLYF